MNRYGAQAREHWTRHAPSRVAGLEDPETFFEDLGEQVAARVETISTSLEAQLPEGLEYLDRVGQLKAIQAQAEEVALAELVFAVTPEPSLLEELEQMLGQLPDPGLVDNAVAQIRMQAAVERGYGDPDEAILTVEEEAHRERLQELRPLVDLERAEIEEMSPEEMRERIEALRPFLQERQQQP